MHRNCRLPIVGIVGRILKIAANMFTHLRFFEYENAYGHYTKAMQGIKQCTDRNSRTKIIAKPVLLLSIIKLMENGENNNFFTYSEIEPIYRDLYAQWLADVGQERATPLCYPFYFLRSDGFWHLVWKTSEVKTENPTAAWLERNCHGASLDPDLWVLLLDKTYRDKVAQFLIDRKISEAAPRTPSLKNALRRFAQMLMIA